jgi:NADP-dependent 3-hydroxy acid dehydrogenase YdfG
LIQQYQSEVLDLCFDVQVKAQVEAMLSDLKSPWNKIDILLNNAGLALGRDSFEDASMQDWETMLQTNVNGLLYVSKTVLPYMIEKKQGHIINIGSIAGKEVYENGNVYCASKFAVDAISKSMRIDLLKHNIKVTAIHPGAVETEFSIVRYKGDEQKANATYKGFTPLTGEDIADTIFYAAQLPEHVCINELTITCTQQANATNFFKKS